MILERAEKVDAEAWLQQRFEEYGDYLREEEREAQDCVWRKDPLWTNTILESVLRYYPWQGKGLVYDETCLIAMIPTTDKFAAAAYARFGNHNWSPPPECHIALWRRWDIKYGLEVMALNLDRVELRVHRPPVSIDEARALAREHYVYCSDTVGELYESFHNLSVRLWQAPWWHFWWD